VGKWLAKSGIPFQHQSEDRNADNWTPKIKYLNRLRMWLIHVIVGFRLHS
jgi:hypothetical protein